MDVVLFKDATAFSYMRPWGSPSEERQAQAWARCAGRVIRWRIVMSIQAWGICYERIVGSARGVSRARRRGRGRTGVNNSSTS